MSRRSGFTHRTFLRLSARHSAPRIGWPAAGVTRSKRQGFRATTSSQHRRGEPAAKQIGVWVRVCRADGKPLDSAGGAEHLRKFLSTFWRDESGLAPIEYAMLLAF